MSMTIGPTSGLGFDSPASNLDDIHVAQEGQSLTGVAQQLGIPFQSLRDANPGLPNPDALRQGQYINLPKLDGPSGSGTPGSKVDGLEGGAPPTGAPTNAGVTTAAHALDAGLAKVKLMQASIDGLQAQAKTAGLTDAEAAKLGKGLQALPPGDRARETKLVQDALASNNPDRALRTYLDLTPKRAAHPDRVTPDIARTLVMGVGTSATNTDVGHKGVIGETQACQAADALINMSKADFSAIHGALEKAGHGGSKKASAANEGALILKSVAAREDQFTKLSAVDKAKNKHGLPSSVAATVTNFAGAIRGKDRTEVVNQTTVLGLSNAQKALQQRWNDSCGPTTIQMTRADTDPVYAEQLHKETIHSVSRGGKIGIEQKDILEGNSGVAKPRGTPGTGMTLDGPLNAKAGPFTHRTYAYQSVGDTPASRTAGMDTLENNLKKGIDVPIRIQWHDGGGHFELASDVRGKTPSREFLITDPWNGRTKWVEEADIAGGDTNFSPGKGKLTHIYPGTPNP